MNRRIPFTQDRRILFGVLLWSALLILALSQSRVIQTSWATNRVMLQLSAALFGNESGRVNTPSALDIPQTGPPAHRARLVYRRALVHDHLEQTDAAAADYLGALQAAELPRADVAHALFRLGMIAYEAGESDDAIRYFERLIDLPGASESVQHLAYAHLYLGELLYETAADLDAFQLHAQKALDLVVEDVTMGRYLRVIYRLIERNAPGDFDQALTMAEYATATLPKNTWTNLARCRVHLSRQELADAQDWCRRSSDLAPTNADAYAWLGIAFLQDDRPVEALAAFEQAASIRPANEWYQNLIRRAQAAQVP